MSDHAALRVFDGLHLRATLHGAGRQGLFVTFDHWRKDRAGFPAMSPVRAAMAMGFASLVVTSSANDWFLNPDLGALRRALQQVAARYPVVRATGFSMGGYGALLFSRDLGLDHVTLYAPQVAIRQDVAPFELRWRKEAALIDAAEDRLVDQIKPDLRGVILFDPCYTPAERRHARAIQALAPGLVLVPLPFSGHPPMGVIMQAGYFSTLQRASIAGTLQAGDLRTLHRAQREKSQPYIDGLLAMLRRRGAPGAELSRR